MQNKEICQSVRSMADDYIDGELGAKEKSIVEAHLSECVDCESFFDERLRIANAVCDSAEEVQQSLHQRIIDSTRTDRTKTKRSRTLRKSAIFAIIAVICTLVAVSMAVLPIWLMPQEPMDTPNAEAGNTTIDNKNDAASGNPSQTPPTDVEENAPENSFASTQAPEGDGKVPEDDASASVTSPPHADTDAPAAESTKPITLPPIFDSSTVETNKIPDGTDITLAVLALSGLLAVASFVAFLISLSSVRKYPTKKEDETDEK